LGRVFCGATRRRVRGPVSSRADSHSETHVLVERSTPEGCRGGPLGVFRRGRSYLGEELGDVQSYELRVEAGTRAVEAEPSIPVSSTRRWRTCGRG
jgi:hypothetical protein